MMKLQKTSSSSLEMVASIEGLLIEILLRLPLKPLIRFKLVSKKWLSVISDEHFMFSRYHNPNPAVGLIFPIQMISEPHEERRAYVISFDKSSSTINNNNPYPPSTTVVDSCNGLLLCKHTYQQSEEGYVYPKQHRYSVFNPTTKKHIVLPQIASRHHLCLAYDPSNSPHFKVVCISITPEMYNPRDQFKVYSSQTRCWRKCGEPFRSQLGFARGLYWNGSIHWISLTNSRKSVFLNPDDEKMVMQAMPASPATSSGNSSMYYCGVSCGHLHYIEDRKEATMELSVYEMRRDYSEWFVKYRVDCSGVIDRLGSRICVLVRGKKDEDSFLVWQREEETLVRHNLVSGTCETIFECEDDEFEQFVMQTDTPLQLIESL